MFSQAYAAGMLAAADGDSMLQVTVVMDDDTRYRVIDTLGVARSAQGAVNLARDNAPQHALDNVGGYTVDVNTVDVYD